MMLTDAGREFFIRHEGAPERPYVPTDGNGKVLVSSGVTIGIGYDLGQTTAPQFKDDWDAVLPPFVQMRLAGVCGKRGSAAAVTVPMLRDIRITMQQALPVFLNISWPKYRALAEQAFPGLSQCPPNTQIALTSLVYNRGAAVLDYDELNPASVRREEMRAIRDAVAEGNLPAIAAQLVTMAHLWEGVGAPGLVERRYAEARLVWPEVDVAAVRANAAGRA